MHTINVNDASPRQLAILLGLRAEEVERLTAQRPFGDVFTFRRALPYRVALRQRTLDIPLLDLNSMSEEELVEKIGLSRETARTVVQRRPFYFLSELKRLRGISDADLELLASVAAPPELAYVDKLSGRPVSLEPDASRVVVNFVESESGEDSLRTVGLPPAFGRRKKGGGPAVFDVPETEDADDVLARLRQKPGVDTVVPGFRVEGEQRFIDPEYCVAQFRADVPVERQDAIVAEAGMETAERHRTPGLVTLHIPVARSRPGALTAALAYLNAQPEVEFAEPNFLGFDDMESAAAPGGSARTRWHHDLIRLQEAWELAGKGSPDVIVAVVDSGVHLEHPALRNAILPRQPEDDWDFTADGGDAPEDEDGHGTFIAGILVGNGALNVQGVCPDCRLLPLRVPLTGQSNSYARRADAILYAVEYAGKRRVVINTSWKTTGDVAVVRRAVATAIARGAVVVASAGNDPERKNQPHFPSDYAGVLSVAAVGPDRSRAEYSFYGDRINVAAPGGSGADRQDPTEDLLSAAPNGGVQVAFGTSFAAPHVAALAALILSQDPTLPPARVQAIIEETAVALGDDGVGRGLIDAAGAVRRARKAEPVRPPDAPSDGLAAINRGDLAALTGRFGLRSLTAQLLVSRRPVADITRIRNTLGLTPEQYAALAATAAPPPPAERRRPAG